MCYDYAIRKVIFNFLSKGRKMRNHSRWYVYPILLLVIGFGVFIAFYDIQIPKETIVKEISYDELQK